jgi:diguanylate cyclase (GGDEF)-like protein
LTLESGLETTCDGISRALGFQHVTAHTLGSNGLTAPIAAVDMAVNDPAINGGLTEAQLVELLTSEFEVEGCYLLPLEAVTARVELPEGIYRSKLNGRGPRAWNRHWLIVPLRDYAGELIGVVAADDPADRLLPSRERLQALRLFVNQAAAALEALNRFEEVRTLAERDPLTRLFNRRAFVHRLVTEAAHCQRHGMPLALVFYDLDEFKQINDSYGHDAGDRELIRFGSMLIEATRAEDEVFRYGGDEFALLLPNCREDEAAAVTARVAAALVPTALSASFGVAVAEPDDANSVDTLLRAADTAMYASKRRASVAV